MLRPLLVFFLQSLSVSLSFRHLDTADSAGDLKVTLINQVHHHLDFVELVHARLKLLCEPEGSVVANDAFIPRPSLSHNLDHHILSCSTDVLRRPSVDFMVLILLLVHYILRMQNSIYFLISFTICFASLWPCLAANLHHLSASELFFSTPRPW